MSRCDAGEVITVDATDDAPGFAVNVSGEPASPADVAVTLGASGSFRAAYCINRLTRLPSDWHHAMAQNPPNGLGRQPPQGTFQIIAR